ncbi:MAG: NAD(P)/FAD-dependent oxidoreductase [Caldimonas sp.]
MLNFDAVVVGAGAAGLHCAAIAGQRGLRVLLVDHAEKVAEKIRISGGGRCNFTNRGTGPANFLSANPDFCRSALARYSPNDFIALLERHRIGWHEKHKGQLFCDESSQAVIDMLLRECEQGSVVRWQPCAVLAVTDTESRFLIETERGIVTTAQLVIATGGLSIPQIGASDWGYRLARQYGHRIVETRPALVPLKVDDTAWARFADLSGLSLPVSVTTGSGREQGRFDEDLLFTHRGLSGPAALQISSYWRPGQNLQIDCTPGVDLEAALLDAKRTSKRQLASVLAELMPRRFSEAWLESAPALRARPMSELRDRDLGDLARQLRQWNVTPNGTEGYRKAEVTSGGVDTRELDSRDMQSRRRRGLHFIGEVADVTGWLGGYNFQWAWASAYACGQALDKVDR